MNFLSSLLTGKIICTPSTSFTIKILSDLLSVNTCFLYPNTQIHIKVSQTKMGYEWQKLKKPWSTSRIINRSLVRIQDSWHCGSSSVRPSIYSPTVCGMTITESTCTLDPDCLSKLKPVGKLWLRLVCSLILSSVVESLRGGLVETPGNWGHTLGSYDETPAFFLLFAFQPCHSRLCLPGASFKPRRTTNHGPKLLKP